MPYRLLLINLLLFISGYAIADEVQDETPVIIDEIKEIPQPPLPVHNGEKIEPDITITRKEKKTIQEYRRGGRLYMIKVVPDVGPAYYFVDTNGDEKMDVQGSDLDRGGMINMWKLLEWD